MSNEQPVDWTIGEAPGLDEPAPETPVRGARPPEGPRQPARRLPRRAWLALAALPVLALLFTVVYARLERLRFRREVEAVVAAQEEARLGLDWTALRATFADDLNGWPEQWIGLLRAGSFPMPIQLPGYWSASQAGQVSAFQQLGAQSARVDVVRELVDSQGRALRFTLPQFYTFAEGAWRQTAPPTTPAEQALHQQGAWVDMDYFAADAAQVAPLSQDLDKLIGQACADWQCPPGLRVPVRFHDSAYLLDSGTAAPALGFLNSWTLQIAYMHTDNVLAAVDLPSSLQGGYAADEASAAQVRRAAGIEALLYTAQHLAFDTTRRHDNPFLDALAAREAARLGLDPPALPAATLANPLLRPDELWLIDGADYMNAGAWTQALVISNQLLAGSTVADEGRLLHALAGSHSAVEWLAAGLGLSEAAASARLETAAAFEAPTPTVLPPSFPPALALNCTSGVVLAALDGQITPLFAASPPDTQVDGWSPDGRRLAVTIGGRLAVVDLLTGQATWSTLPSLPNAYALVWATNTLLAYSPVTRDDLGLSRLLTNNIRLWDSVSRQYMATLEQAYDYRPSPDGQWAAVQYSNTLVVQRTLDTSPVFTATESQSPAWSPNGQHLLYTYLGAAGSEIVIYDLVGGITHTVLSESDSRLPSLPGLPVGGSSISAIWLNGLDQLAVVRYTYADDHPASWAALVSLDGQDMHLLLPGKPGGVIFPSAASADGQFLAAVEEDGIRQGTAIYALPGGQLVRFIPDAAPQGWSRSGHSLALLASGSPRLLREPADPAAQPQPLGPAGCQSAPGGVVWRP